MQQHSTEVVSAYLTKRILRTLQQTWLLIVSLCVLAGCYGYWLSYHRYTPVYEAQALVSVVITNSADLEMEQSDSYAARVSVEYINAAYSYLYSTPENTAELARLMGGRSPAYVSMSSVAETNMFVLSVTGTDTQYMLDSINAVINVFPRFARDIVGPNVIKVIRPAAVLDEPVNSVDWKSSAHHCAKNMLVVALAVVLAVSLPGSRRLVSAQQLEIVISAPCLCHIPLIRKQRKKGHGSAASLLLLNGQGDARYTDAVNRLRLKLVRTLREKNGNTVMVTSSLPGEGKSTVSANLALSLARNGKKVALIDADLRASYLKELFGFTDASEGLAEILNHDLHRLNFLQVPDTTLYLLAGDESIANPTPKLNHDVLGKIMELIKRRFDYVIIDTPPCVMMADAAFFARYADTTLYVIREDYITAAQLQEGFRNLDSAYTSVCGYVLNMSDHKTGSSSSGYGYGYSGYDEK